MTSHRSISSSPGVGVLFLKGRVVLRGKKLASFYPAELHWTLASGGKLLHLRKLQARYKNLQSHLLCNLFDSQACVCVVAFRKIVASINWDRLKQARSSRSLTKVEWFDLKTL